MQNIKSTDRMVWRRCAARCDQQGGGTVRSSGATVPTKAQTRTLVGAATPSLPYQQAATCVVVEELCSLRLSCQTGNQYLARSALNRARDVRPGGVG
ncbi:MAG: hypothetical protein ACK5QX_11705 [bacterium]